MALQEYQIAEFRGIDQSIAENRLSQAFSPDAQNMDTEDGDLAVARGYEKFIRAVVPGANTIRRLFVWRAYDVDIFIVVAGVSIYAYNTSAATPAWSPVYTYAAGTTNARMDILEAKIGSTDYLIFANGETQLVKWDGVNAATAFGSAAQVSDAHVNFIELHYSRLFAAGDPNFPSRLYWSQPPGDTRSIEDWSVDEASDLTSGGHVDVGNTAGDRIVGICALSNQLLIFKQQSVYRLLGDRPSNYHVYKVSADVEETVNSSVTKYGDTPFWFTKNGILFHNGQTTGPLGNARQIKDIAASANISDCKGAENRGKLYFTIKEHASSTYDDAIVVYDIVNATYMMRRGFNVIDIAALDGTLYMVNDERCVYKCGVGTTYDGVQIDAYWKTPLTDLGSKFITKQPSKMLLRGSGNTLLIDTSIGPYTYQDARIMPSDLYTPLDIPLKGEGITLQFKFSNEAGSVFRITGGVDVILVLTKGVL